MKNLKTIISWVFVISVLVAYANVAVIVFNKYPNLLSAAAILSVTSLVIYLLLDAIERNK
jgi:hypothetical protein